MQPFPERLQGYTHELSPSVFHCFLEPGNQMGKLNPLGGTDFTDADMVKVANAHWGSPGTEISRYIKRVPSGLVSTLSSMALMGCLRLQTALCVAAKWLCGASPVGRVARSSAVSTRSLGSPLDWHRISACPWHDGSEKPAGLSQSCRARSGWV